MSVHAQVPPGSTLPPVFDPTGRSGSPPPLQKEQPLQPQLPLLQAPPPSLERRERGAAIRVFLRDIRVVGSTIFTGDELAKVTAPYLNRDITTDDLESLRLGLTMLYINKGYVTSGAIVPDQKVEDGVVTIQIVEGTLTRIDVEGTDWFRPAFLRDRIELGAGAPVNLYSLQERLLMLQQDPRIRQLNAELRPGIARGESELHVKVAENSPWKAWLDFSNYQTPVVGAERGLATVAHQNVTGNGDTFSFTYGKSAGVDPIIDTSYVLPLTKYDTTFSASYRRNDFTIIEQPFKALEISSNAEIIGMTLRQPVYKTVNKEFSLAVTGEHLHNKIRLFGQGFEFIPGMTNGVGNVSALRFIQEWVQRSQTTVLAVRSRFSVGLNVLGATVNSGPVADGQFFSWLGQVQAVQRMEQWGGLQFLERMDLQLANDRLFPLEQMPVGGRFSVRGYRENTLVRDNAFLVSGEARLPVLRFADGEDRLQLAAFTDYGRAWNAKGTTGDPHFLVSVGLGVRWSILPKERVRTEVYWGVPLNFVATPEQNLQDHGIHFQITAQVF